jgi:hypothetical protein
MKSFACILLLAVSGCGAFAGGVHVNTMTTRTAVVSAVLTPATIHAGDTVLVDYLTERRSFDAGNDGYTMAEQKPDIRASRGTLIPLLPEIFSPGDAVPDLEVAQAAIDAVEYIYEYEGYRNNGHYYGVFKAPEVPGQVEIYFFAGAPDGFAPDETTMVFNVDVLP